MTKKTKQTTNTERLELKAQVKIEVNSFTSVEDLQNYLLKICENHSFPAGFTKETFFRISGLDITHGIPKKN